MLVHRTNIFFVLMSTYVVLSYQMKRSGSSFFSFDSFSEQSLHFLVTLLLFAFVLGLKEKKEKMKGEGCRHAHKQFWTMWHTYTHTPSLFLTHIYTHTHTSSLQNVTRYFVFTSDCLINRHNRSLKYISWID